MIQWARGEGKKGQVPKLMSNELVMPSSNLILCRPLLLPSSFFHSIKVFPSESVLPIRWPQYWSFSFSISPSNEYSGLISFRKDWLDLPAVQGTLPPMTFPGQQINPEVPSLFQVNALEKEMATHSSVLAWRIPGTGEAPVAHK